MAEYITEDDITDSLLKGRFTYEIADANQYVDRLAATYQVSHVTVTPLTKKLAVAVACRDLCLNLMGTDATVMMGGDRQEDVYSIKYKIYAQLVKDLQTGILRADFLSDEEKDDEEARGAWTRAVSISRS